MKIALLGATGRVGGALLEEALRRDHPVTAIARNARATLSGRPGVQALDVDVRDAAALGRALAGHDVVLSAVRFRDVQAQAVIAPARAAGVRRLLVVGGAGSLQVAPGVRLLDTPQFPAAYRAEAEAGAAWLAALRAEAGLEWTFLSPSALFDDMPRTGRFRLGGDDLLVDGQGHSAIGFADYAIAMLDEVERPAHVRQRFTVGY